MLEAIELLDRALNLDPHFARVPLPENPHACRSTSAKGRRPTLGSRGTRSSSAHEHAT